MTKTRVYLCFHIAKKFDLARAFFSGPTLVGRITIREDLEHEDTKGPHIATNVIVVARLQGLW